MDLSADLTIRARLVSVDVEAGTRHVGFAEGDEDEPYALFSQPVKGGPLRLELNDPLFAAEDAVTRVTVGDGALLVEIAAARAAELGFAQRIAIRAATDPGAWQAAVTALLRMVPTA